MSSDINILDEIENNYKSKSKNLDKKLNLSCVECKILILILIGIILKIRIKLGSIDYFNCIKELDI